MPRRAMLFNTDFSPLNLIGSECFPVNVSLLTFGMFSWVQFNAAAGIETFDIKWVFTKALDTRFYCPTNILILL